MDVLCLLICYKAEFELNDIDAEAVLFHAVKNSLLDVVKVIRGKGFDMNTPDKNGKTAMFYATQQKNIDVISLLIPCVAVYNISDIDVKAVFFHAVENDLPDVVLELGSRIKGVDVNTCDKNGKNAMYYATQQKNIQLISHLIVVEPSITLVILT